MIFARSLTFVLTLKSSGNSSLNFNLPQISSDPTFSSNFFDPMQHSLKIFQLIFLLAILAIFSSCSRRNTTLLGVDETSQLENQSLSIIFMIGDGMGIPQVSTAFHFDESSPNFERFTSVGLARTESTSHKVTDSAAAATALATGIRSYNRAISVDPDSIAVNTILELLRDSLDYQTGLVSLTSITHATPACFYAHVVDRDMHEEIALQLVDSDLDFFAGGGWKYFIEREDGRNLLDSFKAKNYHVDTSQLSAFIPNQKNAYLLAAESMPSKVEGRGDFLAIATQQSLDFLSQADKPFFLMVEGSYIDWAGHAEDSAMLIHEVIDFDRAIGVALDFLKTHPNTLLVVTADHETGGVSLDKQYAPVLRFGQRQVIHDKLDINFSSNQHSAELVPVFAKGRGEHHFQGIYFNNQIYFKMLNALGLHGK